MHIYRIRIIDWLLLRGWLRLLSRVRLAIFLRAARMAHVPYAKSM
jgi:hypothetical protein